MYNWTDGELVTAAKLNDYSAGMEKLKTATETAKTAAETAQGKAESANTSAQSAKTAAETAKSAAENAQSAAQTSATNAASANTSALAAKTAAESAKTAAETAKTDALKAKAAAETAQGKAEIANTSAQSAKTAAETAQGKAETSETNAAASEASAATDAQRAEDAVAHNPTIQNGVWYVWNPETGAYVSTGVPATGELTAAIDYQASTSQTIPPTGEWVSTPPAVEQGSYLWTRTSFSDGSIAYSVARQGRDGEGAVISVNGKSGDVTLTLDDISGGLDGGDF